MRGKRSGSIACLLPHDSVLSALEGEQRAFRALAASLDPTGGERPFSFLPPFLAYPRNGISGTVEFGPPVAADGWIVRPVSGFDPDSADDTTIDTPRMAPPPGYPDIPRGPYLVLGYAGARATEILDGYMKEKKRAAADTIVLRVWRAATLNYDFEDDGGSLSCRYSFEGGGWKRAKGQ